MCWNSLMIESDIIQSVLDELLDQICPRNNEFNLNKYSPIYYSSQMIENQFNQSINLLNNSLKQLLTYELKTVVENGHLNSTSNIRHSRYYNPATAIRQMNDLKRKLQWIEQRQMFIKQLNLNQQEKIEETKVDLKSMENLWFNQRLKMVENSLELLKNDEEINENQEEEEDEYGCSRCRIYQRKTLNETNFSRKLKQIHREHNYSIIEYTNSTQESDLIHSLSRLADRIGQISHSNSLNSSKKHSSTIKKKQNSHPIKLQSSISLTIDKPPKRTLDESRTSSNSTYLSNHSDLTIKRQKRIASPQSTNVPIHDILTPTWRILSNEDMNNIDQQDFIEDISDENYIRRHIRCELEQETWLTNSTLTLNSNPKKNSTLQTSISLPSSLSTTNTKQYRLTTNGIS